MEKGAKLTYIDPRVSITATKADRYWMIRPGTDLALNYALIHTILKERLYDQDYVKRWVNGLRPNCRPLWSLTPRSGPKQETGIPAGEIVALAREAAAAKPAVVFHYGYRGAHHANDIYFRRSIIILNALMGSIEAKGGLFFKKGPKDVGPGRYRQIRGPGIPQDHRSPGSMAPGAASFPVADASHGNRPACWPRPS